MNTLNFKVSKEYLLVIFDKENHEYSVTTVTAASDKEAVSKVIAESSNNYSVMEVKAL